LFHIVELEAAADCDLFIDCANAEAFRKDSYHGILKGKHLKPKNQKMNNRASVDKAKAPFV
jgi:hypothetical protein